MKWSSKLGLAAFLAAFMSLIIVIPATAQDTAPRFETAECLFAVPAGRSVDCGYLTVAEDRSDPDNVQTLRLAVAIFRSPNDSAQPDPLIYLEGGPGGSALRLTAPNFDLLLAGYLEDRDVILIDQRGTGYSEPALDCPEAIDSLVEALSVRLSIEEQQAVAAAAVLDCRQRLLDEGVNLSAYNSTQSAADINELRLALGYEQVNLYGTSYGTKLALTVMRDYPTGVRTAVLDSIFPLETSLTTAAPTHANEALEELFAACNASETCRAAYPDFREVFFSLYEQLNAQPLDIEITLPTSGEKVVSYLDGYGLAAFTFQSMYVAPLLGMLPSIIYEVRDGNLAQITQILDLFNQQLTNTISLGTFYSTHCAEEVPYSDPQVLAQAYESYPIFRGALGISGIAGETIFDICAAWGAKIANPIENEAVSSAIPALLLTGEFDPVTSTAWGEQTSANLSNAYFFDVPSSGHAPSLGSVCVQQMIATFLNEPGVAPDSSCLADIAPIQFEIPQTVLNLVPFTSEVFGLSGIIPEGWDEVSPGTYAQSSVSTTALLQQALPGGVEGITDLLSTQLGLDAFPVSFDTREANGIAWNLYELEVSGMPARLAAGESDGTGYLVLLISTSAEVDTYYEQVFLPAVDALVPSAS